MSESTNSNAGESGGTSYLTVPFNSHRLQSLPDIRQFYKNEYKERLKEISAAQGAGASKMFTKFFGGMKKGPESDQTARISGLEIAEIKKITKTFCLN